jgi:hypothetical protein
MTCIAAAIDDREIVIGGDSAGVSGYDLHLYGGAKVFKKDGFLFGYSGSFRLGQVIEHSFKAPKREANVSLDTYMATVFVDEVRASLKRGGVKKVENEVEETEGNFIVGHAGRLFIVEQDFAILSIRDNFTAVGCGESAARGALYSERFGGGAVGSGRGTARQQVKIALLAAQHLSIGVRGPFRIVAMRVGRSV